MHEYLQGKQEEFSLAAEVRSLAVEETERMAMLADVVAPSPRSITVIAELEELQSQIVEAQTHLKDLLERRRMLITSVGEPPAMPEPPAEKKQVGDPVCVDGRAENFEASPTTTSTSSAQL